MKTFFGVLLRALLIGGVVGATVFYCSRPSPAPAPVPVAASRPSYPVILAESYPLIDMPTSAGSGTVIGCAPTPDGLFEGTILTATHVIQDALRDVFAEGPTGKAYKLGINILVKSPRYSVLPTEALVFGESDVALLRVVFPYPVRTVPFATRGPALGETVWCVGWPYMERSGSLFTITIGCRSGDDRFTAASLPGNSGSALLNVDGEVVGLMNKLYRLQNDQLGIQIPLTHMGVCVPLSTLRGLLFPTEAASRPTSR